MSTSRIRHSGRLVGTTASIGIALLVIISSGNAVADGHGSINFGQSAPGVAGHARTGPLGAPANPCYTTNCSGGSPSTGLAPQCSAGCSNTTGRGVGNFTGNQTGRPACTSCGAPLGGYSGGLGSEYWFGADYLTTAPTYLAWEVWTSIQIPSSPPVPGDQYAVVFSVFDTQNYYDQIGFASDYGCSGCGNSHDTWTIAWEQGIFGYNNGKPGCGWNGTYTRDAYSTPGLTPNAWYTFAILNAPNGSISFRVSAGEDNTTAVIWHNWQSDSASGFLIQTSDDYCHGYSGQWSTFDATLYEEVAYINGTYAQAVPRWDFLFNQTSVEYGASTISMLPDSSYQGYGAGSPPTLPHGYWIDPTYGPDILRLANEAFAETYTTDVIDLIAGGGTVKVYGSILAVGTRAPTDWALVNSYTYSLGCTWPTGGGGAFGGGAYWPGFIGSGNYYSVSAPAHTPTGLYYGSCTAQITSTSPVETNTWIWYINVT